VLELQPTKILPRVPESSPIKPTSAKAPPGPRSQTPASLSPGDSRLPWLFHSTSPQAGQVYYENGVLLSS